MTTQSTQSGADVAPGQFVVALANLNWQRLNDVFCDITLSVCGRPFRAHRNILAAFSPYFRAMFTGDMLESRKEEVVIHGMVPEIFDQLLEFIYSGVIIISADNCQDIFAAADMLELSDVLNLCCAFLKKQLDPSNVIGFYLFADRFSRQDLIQSCEGYIHRNFTQVVAEDEFLTVPKEFVQRLLRSEDLKIDSEFEAFNAALKWILHNVFSRRRYVYDILSSVRFPLIPPSALDNYISQCPDLSLRIALRKLLQDHNANKFTMFKFKPCHFQPRKSARKSIYVIGGMCYPSGRRWMDDSRTLDAVESFDTYSQQWTSRAPLITPRSDHDTVGVNGQIFVIGGESDLLLYDSAERYDPVTKVWTSLPSMTSPRSALGCCVVEDRIYAIGGWMGDTVSDTMEMFDHETQAWKQVGRMKSPRYGMSVISHQGLIYVLGGINDFGLAMHSVDCYNPHTNLWHPLEGMIEARTDFGSAIIDDQIYVVGGKSSDGIAMKTIEKYSIQENTWAAVRAMSKSRAGPAVASVGTMLYVIGGEASDDQLCPPSSLDYVECYDVVLDKWAWLDRIPTGRYGASAVVL